MIRGFTFERALSWPFTAPHAATFPWIFAAAYACVFIAAFGLVGLMASGDLQQWFALMQSMEEAGNPEAAAAAFWGGISRLAPWMILSALVSWIIWAMFETASQRRYIWGQGFTLGFGADEARMMLVGLLWNLLGLVLLALPVLLIMGSTFWTLSSSMSDPGVIESPEFANRIMMQMFGVFGLLLLLGPLYAFFATRLSPCFALTMMHRRVRFFDAWNVSRGRFWPILGAYLILAVAGWIVSQVIVGIAQTIMMPAMMNVGRAAESGADIQAVFLSPAFLIPMGIYGFVMLFAQGLLQHVVAGPAAFAARHDPRGGIDTEAQIEAFV